MKRSAARGAIAALSALVLIPLTAGLTHSMATAASPAAGPAAQTATDEQGPRPAPLFGPEKLGVKRNGAPGPNDPIPTGKTDSVLKVRHDCSPTLYILAQDMTTAELQAACTSMLGEDKYFHNVVKDPGKLAGDLTVGLEVAVYATRYDYQTAGVARYGLNPAYGGESFDGDPSRPGNMALFAAYEEAGLGIRNLNHEYTHYLDAIYNMAGTWEHSSELPSTWWGEGIAEYIGYGYPGRKFDSAFYQASLGTYSLGTLFDTTYANSPAGGVRIYEWGYLATRYMLEQHWSDMEKVLGYYRGDKYQQAYDYLKSLAPGYEADWREWLKGCANNGNCRPPGTGPTTPPTTPPTTTPPPTGNLPDCSTLSVARNCQFNNVSAVNSWYWFRAQYLPAGVSKLTLSSSGGTGNCDLYYSTSGHATTSTAQASSRTAGTNAETVVINNPKAGWNYFSLKGETTCSGVTLAIRW